MKTLIFLLGLVGCTQVFASQVIEKGLDAGVDNAIKYAFNECATELLLENSENVPLEAIRKSITTLSIDGALLRVSFDDEAVKTAIASNPSTINPGFNGTVLCWLADLTQNEEGQVLSGDGVNPFVAVLDTQSKKNGYTLTFPIMDLEDVQKVNAQTIITHSDTILATASQRYDAKYFLAGVINKDDESDAYSVKWNVFDKEGKALHHGEESGTFDLLSERLCKDVANAFSGNTTAPAAEIKTSAGEDNPLDIAKEGDNIILGPVRGGVRVLITDVYSVMDISRIKRILITYGYESDIRVLGYEGNGIVFLIPTGSSPAILDGTLTHASEFSKIAAWTYHFNKSSGDARPAENIGTVGGVANRVTSDIKAYSRSSEDK